MVSFIHNGIEIPPWMGYNFKTKSTKPKATFLKIRTSFLNFTLHIIRLAQGHLNCTPTHWNSYFYSYTYEKTFVAVHFTKRYFLSELTNRKVMGLVWRYNLLAGDTSQVSIFSMHKIKMSKQHRFIL